MTLEEALNKDSSIQTLIDAYGMRDRKKNLKKITLHPYTLTHGFNSLYSVYDSCSRAKAYAYQKCEERAYLINVRCKDAVVTRRGIISHNGFRFTYGMIIHDIETDKQYFMKITNAYGGAELYEIEENE